MNELRSALTDWLFTLPGAFYADTHEGVLTLAREKSGINANAKEFEECLDGCGYRPQWRGPDRFVLALPERTPGSKK